MRLPISQTLVDALITRAMRTPYIHLDGYMERYWLIPYNRTGVAVRLHKILSSDKDRHLHNHPWPFISVILRGGYLEETEVSKDRDPRDLMKWSYRDSHLLKVTYYGEGDVLFRKPDHYHRLILAEGCPVWTLFITGPMVSRPVDGAAPWGFKVDGVHVPANEYLGDKYVRSNYSGSGGNG